MDEPRFELLCEMTAQLEPPQMVGQTPQGNRQIFYVQSGTFTGPRLKGDVLPGGGDWFLVRPDGVGELDVRAPPPPHHRPPLLPPSPRPLPPPPPTSPP